MSSLTFTFNGTSTVMMGLGVISFDKSAGERDVKTEDIEGGRGGYSAGVDEGSRTIPAVVDFWEADHAQARLTIEAVVAWLSPAEDCELTASDETARTYYARAGAVKVTQKYAHYILTFDFVCSDPCKWGASADTAVTDGANTLSNPGGIETYPTYVVAVDAPATFLELLGDYGFLRIGRAAKVSDTPGAAQTVVLADDCSSLSGWTESEVVESGETDPDTMAMGSGAASFGHGPGLTGDDFGSGSGMHGPTLIKPTPGDPLEDFLMEFIVYVQNTTVANSIGRIDFMPCSGTLGSPVVEGKIGIADWWSGLNQVQFYARAGTGSTPYIYNDICRTAAGPSAWNDLLPGRLTISRIDGKWTATIQKRLASGAWGYGMTVGPFQETAATADITHIAVNVAKFGTYAAPARIEVSEVNIWRVNTGVISGGGAAFMLLANDEVSVNMRTGEVLLWGSDESRIPRVGGGYVPMSALIHYNSGPFPIAAGSSDVQILADEGVGVTGTATVRARYL